MGISVSVRLLVDRVPDATWRRIYADTLRVLRGWPDPPLGLGYREVGGARVAAYTREFERKDGWCIVGDAHSRRGAESFELPMILRDSEGPTSARETASKEKDVALDVLQVLAEEDQDKPTRLSRLLGSKTQGEPYHILVVAVATLIENRLTGVALARGDFDINDADRACGELGRILGESFDRPVLLEPERIRSRVPNLDAVRLSKSHTCQIDPVAAVLLERFLQLRRTAIQVDLQAKALVCSNINELDETTRSVFARLGSHMAGLAGQMLPAFAMVDRNRSMLRAIAQGTTGQCLKLTDMAWDCIESSDSETLEFLFSLSQLKCDRLEVHQVFRAIYENPVVREYIATVWRNQLRAPRGMPPKTAP